MFLEQYPTGRCHWKSQKIFALHRTYLATKPSYVPLLCFQGFLLLRLVRQVIYFGCALNGSAFVLLLARAIFQRPLANALFSLEAII